MWIGARRCVRAVVASGLVSRLRLGEPLDCARRDPNEVVQPYPGRGDDDAGRVVV